jgi:Ase1/PRC1/MAP65 family protein
MGGANRRLSLGGATMQPPKTDMLHSKTARAAKKTEDLGLSPGKFFYHSAPAVLLSFFSLLISSQILMPNALSGSRGLDIAGLPIKKLSFNASTQRETETPRKPFAQIAPANNIPSTPVRPISNDTTEEENRTPKTFATLNPKTPMTVTAPMQMAMTPALFNKVIATPASLFQQKPEPPTLHEDIEYSFEERRLAAYQARLVA